MRPEGFQRLGGDSQQKEAGNKEGLGEPGRRHTESKRIERWRGLFPFTGERSFVTLPDTSSAFAGVLMKQGSIFL